MARLRVEIDSSGARAGAAEAKRHIKSVGDEATTTGRKIDGLGTKGNAAFAQLKSAALGAKAAFAILAGSLGLGAVVAMGMKFETVMTSAAAVMRATEDQAKRLTDAARQMGATTEWSARQAGEALQFLGMAGFEADKAIAALPGTLDLATAGQIDLGRAADIASNALTAMQLPVEQLSRVNDVLVGTITRTNTNMEMMAESFKYSAPVANALGYSIEELSSYIGILGNAGIQGSMAGTQLAMAFQQVGEVFEKIGKDGEGKKLNDALKEMKDAGWGAAEVMEIFGERGGRAALVLMGLTDEVKKLDAALQKSQGEAKRIADAFRETFEGRFLNMKSAVEELAMRMFTVFRDDMAESLDYFTGVMRDNTDRITRYCETIKNGFNDIAAEIGPALVELARLVLGVVDAFEKLSRILEGKKGIIWDALFGASGVRGVKEVLVLLNTGLDKLNQYMEDAIDTTDDLMEKTASKIREVKSEISELESRIRAFGEANARLIERGLSPISTGAEYEALKRLRQQLGELESEYANLDKSRRDALRSTGVVESAWAESWDEKKAQYEELTKKTAEVKDETKKLAVSTKDAEDAAEKLAEMWQNVSHSMRIDEIERIGGATAEFNKQLVETTKKYSDWMNSLEKAGATEEMLRQVRQAMIQTLKDLEFTEESRAAAALRAAPAQYEAERRAYIKNLYADQIAAGEMAVEETEEQFEKLAESQSDTQKKMLEDIQTATADAFYTIFTDIEDGWKKLWEEAKDYFIKVLAQIVAEAAMRRVIIPVLASVGVLSTATGAAATGAAGGGSSFGLLDIASLTSQGYQAFGGGSGLSFLNTPIWGPGSIFMGGSASTMSGTLSGLGIGNPGAYGGMTGGFSSTAPSWGSLGLAGALGSLGYTYLGGMLGLPQGQYSGIGAGVGAAGGFAMGAGYGSWGGPIGAIIGAIVGGVLSSLIGSNTKRSYAGGTYDIDFNQGVGGPVGGGDLFTYEKTSNASRRLNQTAYDAIDDAMEQVIETVLESYTAIYEQMDDDMKARIAERFEGADFGFKAYARDHDPEELMEEFYDSLERGAKDLAEQLANVFMTEINTDWMEQEYGEILGRMDPGGKLSSAVEFLGKWEAAIEKVNKDLEEGYLHSKYMSGDSWKTPSEQNFKNLQAAYGPNVLDAREYTFDVLFDVSEEMERLFGGVIDSLRQKWDAAIAKGEAPATSADFLSTFGEVVSSLESSIAIWESLNTTIDEMIEPASEYAKQVKNINNQFDSWIETLRELEFAESAVMEIEAKRTQILDNYATDIVQEAAMSSGVLSGYAKSIAEINKKYDDWVKGLEEIGGKENAIAIIEGYRAIELEKLNVEQQKALDLERERKIALIESVTEAQAQIRGQDFRMWQMYKRYDWGSAFGGMPNMDEIKKGLDIFANMQWPQIQAMVERLGISVETLVSDMLYLNGLYEDHQSAIQQEIEQRQKVIDAMREQIASLREQLELARYQAGGGSMADYYMGKIMSMKRNADDLTLDDLSDMIDLLSSWYSAAIREEQETARLWQQVADRVESLISNIDSIITSISGGGLNVALPSEKYAEAQLRYEELYRKATGPDATTEDIMAFANYAQTYLSIAQENFKSSPEYQRIYRIVMQHLEDLRDQLAEGGYDELIYRELRNLNDEVDFGMINLKFEELSAWIESQIELWERKGIALDFDFTDVPENVQQVITAFAQLINEEGPNITVMTNFVLQAMADNNNLLWSDFEQVLIDLDVPSNKIATIKAVYNSVEAPGLLTWAALEYALKLKGVDDTAIKTIEAAYKGTGVLTSWPVLEAALRLMGLDDTAVKTIEAAWLGIGSFLDWPALKTAMEKLGINSTARKTIEGAFTNLGLTATELDHLLEALGVKTEARKTIYGVFTNQGLTLTDLQDLLRETGVPESIIRTIMTQISGQVDADVQIEYTATLRSVFDAIQQNTYNTVNYLTNANTKLGTISNDIYTISRNITNYWSNTNDKLGTISNDVYAIRRDVAAMESLPPPQSSIAKAMESAPTEIKMIASESTEADNSITSARMLKLLLDAIQQNTASTARHLVSIEAKIGIAFNGTVGTLMDIYSETHDTSAFLHEANSRLGVISTGVNELSRIAIDCNRDFNSNIDSMASAMHSSAMLIAGRIPYIPVQGGLVPVKVVEMPRAFSQPVVSQSENPIQVYLTVQDSKGKEITDREIRVIAAEVVRDAERRPVRGRRML